MFEVFSLISDSCPLKFFAFAFAFVRCEQLLWHFLWWTFHTSMVIYERRFIKLQFAAPFPNTCILNRPRININYTVKFVSSLQTSAGEEPPPSSKHVSCIIREKQGNAHLGNHGSPTGVVAIFNLPCTNSYCDNGVADLGFPRRGHESPKRVQKHIVWHNLAKTAWKWKKLDWKGERGVLRP